MSSPRALAAPTYRRLSRADLGAVLPLDYDRRQIAEFLDPIEDIIGAVRAGPAHAMIGIEEAGALIGFFVLHPDPRDHACWWLGWFAIDRAHQGRGYGRLALSHIIAMLGRIDGCRRIRLLVEPGNAGAWHLYEKAGFQDTGCLDERWSILEYELPVMRPDAETRPAHGLAIHALPPKRMRRRPRLRSSVGPFAERSKGAVRGPPAEAAPGISKIRALP